MEYGILSAVVALALGMKFTVYTRDQHKAEYLELKAKVERLEEAQGTHDKEVLKNVMTTMAPIAVAVQKLNKEVGIR